MSERAKTAEELWISQARAGSDEAFARLAEGYRAMIRHLAESLQTEEVAADDLEQEGLMGLFGAVRRFDADNGASFRTFVYVCARHRMLSVLQKSGKLPLGISLDDERTEEIPTDEEFDPEQRVLAMDDEAELDKRLRLLLTPTEYEVLRLHMDGYSYREVASKLQIGGKTVDNALQRIRRKLK